MPQPRKLFPAEAQDDPGAKPQIVLAVVETVGDFGHEVLGLYGANRDVPGHLEINAAARRQGKIILGACRLGNAVGCANASEESLNERRKFPVPETYSGPSKIGEKCSGKRAVPAAGRVKAGQISDYSEPVCDVVLELTTPALSNVCCRGRHPGDVGIYINARITEPAV